jgi:hypothetical protein
MVGEVSTIVFKITPKTNIPQNGIIYVMMPKWNPNSSFPLSYIDIYMNPSPVTCSSPSHPLILPSCKITRTSAINLDSLEIKGMFDSKEFSANGNDFIEIEIESFK